MTNTLIKVSVLFLCLFFAGEVSACMCGPGPVTAFAEMETSDKVFVGKIMAIREFKRWSKDPLSYTPAFEIRLKVKRAFKGVAGADLVLTVDNGGCDSQFTKGEEWLVFASVFENELTTSGCTRSRLAEDAVQELKCLEGGLCIERCIDCIEQNGDPPISRVLRPH